MFVAGIAFDTSDMQTSSCHVSSPFKESRPILFFFPLKHPQNPQRNEKSDLPYYIPFYECSMNTDTAYSYPPKLKESTKDIPLITSLLTNRPHILGKLSYHIKLGIMYSFLY